MNYLSKLAATLVAAPVLALSLAFPAYAAAAGQIEGGNIYRVRNVTQNGAFGDPINADKCETVQFKVRIHNPGPDPLTGVTVKATLPASASISHSSMVTVSAANANPTSVTDTAGVNLPAAYAISYESGSTQLLDSNNTVMQNLPDGITGSGVSVPNGVGVSLEQIRFVQFKANIGCPEQPKEKGKVSIRKIAEDASGKELSAVPTNTFSFKVTCDGKTATVVYNSTPQAAGECTVGSTVTITENAVDGWTIISPSTQNFTVTKDGVTAVFKNRQVAKPAVKPVVTKPAKGVEVLPKTGAGSAVALFTGVSALAGAGHFVYRRYL